MKSNIRVKIAEGSNPPQAGMIQSLGRNCWRIIPWQEYPEGKRIGLYHFRLDVSFFNSGSHAEDIEVTIVWPHSPAIVNQLLNFVYILEPSGRLRRFEGQAEGSFVHVRTRLIPGQSWMSTNPPWHPTHHQAWCRQMQRRGASLITLGYTAERRSIQTLQFGLGTKTAIVTARLHPYESASSYSALGVAEWLMKKGPAQRKILKEWRILVVPMANPDGVAHGCTRLTGIRGLDLNIESYQKKDATAETLKRWLTHCRPDLFIDFHNWMSQTVNGLYYMEKPDLWAFLEAFDAMIWDGRTWYADQVGADLKPGDPERQVFGRYCLRNFGTLAYVVEFPWHGSTIKSLKESGVRTIRAALTAHGKLRASSSATAPTPPC